MKCKDKVKEILNKQNGLVTASQITNENIPRYYLTKMVQEGTIFKVDRGVYGLPEVWEDEMFILQYKYSKGIFSHETALYIHNLTDRTPMKFTMTFPYGYHTESIKNENIKMKKVVMYIYELGVTKAVSPYGNTICLYDIERTLCDIVKGNNTCDIQVVNQAMKQYASSKNKDITKLMQYAETLRVKQKILNYMEVLL